LSNTKDFEVALTKCFLCGGDHEIIMNTRLTPRDAAQIKEMHGKVVTKDPCNKCQSLMEQGVIVIVFDEEKSDDMSNPYRTGGWFVLKVEAMERLKEILDEQGKQAVQAMIDRRVGFLPEKLCRGVMGLYNQIPQKTLEE